MQCDFEITAEAVHLLDGEFGVVATAAATDSNRLFVLRIEFAAACISATATSCGSSLRICGSVCKRFNLVPLVYERNRPLHEHSRRRALLLLSKPNRSARADVHTQRRGQQRAALSITESQLQDCVKTDV